MAERRKLSDIIFGRTTEEKRYNFFRDEDSLYNNQSYIQGWNTRAGFFDVTTLGNGSSNSAVTACLQVLGTSFSEATLQVKTYDTDNLVKTIENQVSSIRGLLCLTGLLFVFFLLTIERLY